MHRRPETALRRDGDNGWRPGRSRARRRDENENLDAAAGGRVARNRLQFTDGFDRDGDATGESRHQCINSLLQAEFDLLSAPLTKIAIVIVRPTGSVCRQRSLAHRSPPAVGRDDAWASRWISGR